MMRIGKWVLGIAALVLLFGSVADAQMQANTLCIQAGAGVYTGGKYNGYPNHGGFKYFPSYSHIPSAPMGPTNLIYPWKIAGWAWTGMQFTTKNGPVWYWESCLQHSTDNPYSTGLPYNMSFDYPVMFCTGAESHAGAPMPIYGGLIPSYVPDVGGQGMVHPSSMGGLDGYMNIFATGGASWLVPSTTPMIGYNFGFDFGGCPSVVTLPSSESIVLAVWDKRGQFEFGLPYGQYLVADQYDRDCMNGGANKGRNYSITSDFDNGSLWSWYNGCAGTNVEWTMCLWVCDTVSIPVNIPGSTNSVFNPFYSKGFSVGSGTLTPNLSSNCVKLGFMSQDYTGSQGARIALAALSFGAPSGPYCKKGSRLPHGWDLATTTFLNIAPIFLHTLQAGYPAGMFGTTVGGHSAFVPYPADPVLKCAEFTYSTFAYTDNSGSAGYQVCYF